MGLLTQDTASRLRDDVAQRETGGPRIAGLLATIGTLCIALAVIAFVAANWEEIPRVAKLVGILVLVAGAHAAAARAALTGRRLVADLLTMFATLVYVAGLALIGQIYHLPTDWPGGAMLVALGSLAAAWLCRSRASLIVASVAASCWLLWLSEIPQPTPVSTLAAVLLLAATTLHVAWYGSLAGRWAVLVQAVLVYYWLAVGFLPEAVLEEDDLVMRVALLAPVALGAFLIAAGRFGAGAWSARLLKRAGVAPGDLGRTGESIGVLFLIAVALIVLAAPMEDEAPALAEVLAALPWPVWAAFAGAALLTLGGLSSATDRRAVLTAAGAAGLAVATVLLALAVPDAVVLVAAAVLLTTIGFSVAGTVLASRTWSGLGNFGIAATLLYLLHETVGSLLGQAVFFLLAGAALVAAAVVLARRARRRSAPAAPAQGEGAQ